jgi:hypothetical protein
MQAHPRRPTSVLKQNISALVAVASYIALAFLLIRAWNFLSEEANAFISNVEYLGTP